MENIETKKVKRSYNLEELDIYRNSIKLFAAEWPNKPKEERGRKLTVRTVSIGLAAEINILINKGYTVPDVVAALYGVGFIISPATLKAYFSSVKVKKYAKSKKTVNKISAAINSMEIATEKSDSDDNTKVDWIDWGVNLEGKPY